MAKWIKQTKIAEKLYKGKILNYRLDQKTGEFEMQIDDGYLNAEWNPGYGTLQGLASATHSHDIQFQQYHWLDGQGWTTSGSIGGPVGIRGTYGVYIDPDTCATKDEDGYLVFAKKEVESES